MLKLNIGLGDNRRLVVLGITEANLGYMFNDKPIAFAANQVMVHGVQGVSIVGVRDLGHFLLTVGTGLGMSDEDQQKFIDTYRRRMLDKAADEWFPWMIGSGHLENVSKVEITVACGFIVQEAAARLVLGKFLEASGSVLGLRSWDRLVMYYEESGEQLIRSVISKVLPYYSAPDDVIKSVDSYLKTGHPGTWG